MKRLLLELETKAEPGTCVALGPRACGRPEQIFPMGSPTKHSGICRVKGKSVLEEVLMGEGGKS